MAGYSKGIVDTRKLNENNKAKLGRRGDTEIREVDNRASHVSALEAYLIDVNGKTGEEYAKRVGAGTVNPLTGMPEYHFRDVSGLDEASDFYKYSMEHNKDWDTATTKHTGMVDGQPFTPDYEAAVYGDPDTPGGDIDSNGGSDTNAPDPYSYEALSDVTGKQLKDFDPNLGAGDVQYFQDIFTDKPFDFLKQQKGLTTGRAGKVKGFEERGLESTYEATMGALASQEATLGRTAGRGLRESGRGRDIAASRSGLATSGTITQAYETQKKDLFQDYRAGMGDIRQERGTALGALTLGKDVAGYDYDYTVAGASLDFDKNTFSEQQRQLDEYWEMIGLRQSVG